MLLFGIYGRFCDVATLFTVRSTEKPMSLRDATISNLPQI